MSDAKNKKGGKKGSKKQATPPGSAGADAANLVGANGKNPQEEIAELRAKLEEIGDDLSKEMELRNYFQLERDKIYSFYEIAKKELEDVKAEKRNKDRENEEMEQRHQVEMKVYKQKVRHLLYEQKITIDRLKIEAENALKIQQEEFRNKMLQLKKDKRALKEEAKIKELAHEENIKALKVQQNKEITKLRQEFERQLKEMQLKAEKKMKALREDMDLRRTAEIADLEERKNDHIKELMAKHEEAFAQIKNYYNVITTNNLVLIKSLKDEVANMKKNEAHNEKLMFEIAQENKRLSEPLTRALKEVDQMRTELANYANDKLSLRNAKNRLALLEEQLKNLSWEHEVLEQRHAQVQKERDELYERFETAIQEVHQKSSLQTLLLQKQVETLSAALEKKEATIEELLKRANIPQAQAQEVSRKLDELLEEKNTLIRDLRWKVEALAKAHGDTVRVFQAKLKEYGIPFEELGFEPLKFSATSTTGSTKANSTTGPAGLVVS